MPHLGQAEDVLWLLPGVTGAAVDGTDTFRGTACRRLAAHVDMARASAAVEGGLRLPRGTPGCAQRSSNGLGSKGWCHLLPLS